MSCAASANIKLTHDAPKGTLVVAEGAMAYLARNSLGVAYEELAQVVEAGAGDDCWCGNGRANDDWSGPAACGSWWDAEWMRQWGGGRSFGSRVGLDLLLVGQSPRDGFVVGGVVAHGVPREFMKSDDVLQ